MATFWQVIDPVTFKVQRTWSYLKNARASAQKQANETGKSIQIAKSGSATGGVWVYPKKAKNPTIPVGKFIPARLNKDGSVSFVVESGKHKGARKANPKGRVKNVEQGFYNATGFHPIRSSSDYRSEALSGPEGERARSGRRGTGPRKKKAVKKTARKATRKAVKKIAKKRATKRKR